MAESGGPPWNLAGYGGIHTVAYSALAISLRFVEKPGTRYPTGMGSTLPIVLYIYTNQAGYLLGRPPWGVTQLRYRPPRILVAIRRRKDLPIKKLCDDSAEPGVIFN